MCTQWWLRVVVTAAMTLVAAGDRLRHGDHTHYNPGQESSHSLRDDQLVRDYDHIKEDVSSRYNMKVTDDVSDLEMEFYYFQLHDFDNNGRLDGLELLAALNHAIDSADPVDQADKGPVDTDDPIEQVNRLRKQRRWNEKFEYDAKVIDDIFAEADVNVDGFISYAEFAASRQKEKET